MQTLHSMPVALQCDPENLLHAGYVLIDCSHAQSSRGESLKNNVAIAYCTFKEQSEIKMHFVMWDFHLGARTGPVLCSYWFSKELGEGYTDQ